MTTTIWRGRVRCSDVGTEVPLLSRIITTPIAIEVRRGALERLAPLLADGQISSGGKVAVIVGPGRGEEVAREIRGGLPDATFVPLRGSGSVQDALQAIEELRAGWFDAVVGIGGGRTLDAAKYAASMAGLPFVAVATTLTNDGLASPVASLASAGRKASYGVTPPLAVFVDIDHVRDAPVEHTRSGVGDVLSNLSALADWELAREVTGEPVDGLAASLARSAADALLPLAPGSDRFLTSLADSLILSGIAMSAAGSSRPCSGACHEISHALDALHSSPGLHGAQVALGALFATWWRRDEDLLAILRDAVERHGLPATPEQLGITNADFAEALLEAPRTRPGRFTVLEHRVISADAVHGVIEDYVVAITS